MYLPPLSVPVGRGACNGAQRGKQAPKAGMAARASAARRARSTAKTTRPVPAERKAARSAEAPARAPLHAPRTTGTESRGKYVYCIIRSDDPLKFGPVGIGTEPADVHTVNYQELAAVVSDTPVEVFDATR